MIVTYSYNIISATVPLGIQCVFDPMQNLQSSEEEGNRRFLSFKGKQVPGAFSPRLLRDPLGTRFLTFFGSPFGRRFETIMGKNGVWKKSQKKRKREHRPGGLRHRPAGLRQRRGPAKGGEASPRCKCWPWHMSSTPCYL